MPVFYINLARRTERRLFMERQFKILGIRHERVEGIDGQAFSSIDRKRNLDAFRWWCARGYGARNGEIGCAMSHQKIYKKMVDENIPCACVLEDDITLGPNFQKMVMAGEQFAAESARPMVLNMAPYWQRPASEARSPEFARVPLSFSAGAYMLNLAAAATMLCLNNPVRSSADDWGRWSRLGGIELYDANPLVCHQEAYASVPVDPAFLSDTIDSGTVFVSNMSTSRRFLHKCVRCIGLAIDRIIG